MSLDPIMAIQVLDLVIRARDINKVSSLYVTKKIHEIPHLANFRAAKAAGGEILIREAQPAELPATRVIVLDNGRIVFAGTVEEFHKSDRPVIRNYYARSARPLERSLRHQSGTNGGAQRTYLMNPAIQITCVSYYFFAGVALPHRCPTPQAKGFSSALGPYIEGIGTSSSRRYTDNWPR